MEFPLSRCFYYVCNTGSFRRIYYKGRYILELHREIWRIIDYKDFYDKASANRSVYTAADEFIRGWSDSTLLLFVFPEERLRQYPVSENDGEERSRFSAGEKERERKKR